MHKRQIQVFADVKIQQFGSILIQHHSFSSSSLMNHRTLSPKPKVVDCQIKQPVKHLRKVHFISSLVDKYYSQDSNKGPSIYISSYAKDCLVQDVQKYRQARKSLKNVARQRYEELQRGKALHLSKDTNSKQKQTQLDLTELLIEDEQKAWQIKPTRDGQKLEQSGNFYEKYILCKVNKEISEEKTPCKKQKMTFMNQNITCQKVKKQYFSNEQTTTVFTSIQKDKPILNTNPKTKEFTIDIDSIPLVESMINLEPKMEELKKPNEENERLIKTQQTLPKNQSPPSQKLLTFLLFYVLLLTLVVGYLLIDRNEAQHKYLMVI